MFLGIFQDPACRPHANCQMWTWMTCQRSGLLRLRQGNRFDRSTRRFCFASFSLWQYYLCLTFDHFFTQDSFARTSQSLAGRTAEGQGRNPSRFDFVPASLTAFACFLMSPESTMVCSFGGYPVKPTNGELGFSWLGRWCWRELARQPGRFD